MKVWRRLKCDIDGDRMLWVRKPPTNWKQVYLIENYDFISYIASVDITDFIPMVKPKREPRRYYVSPEEIYSNYDEGRTCSNVKDMIEKMYDWEWKTFIPRDDGE